MKKAPTPSHDDRFRSRLVRCYAAVDARASVRLASELTSAQARLRRAKESNALRATLRPLEVKVASLERQRDEERAAGQVGREQPQGGGLSRARLAKVDGITSRHAGDATAQAEVLRALANKYAAVRECR